MTLSHSYFHSYPYSYSYLPHWVYPHRNDTCDIPRDLTSLAPHVMNHLIMVAGKRLAKIESDIGGIRDLGRVVREGSRLRRCAHWESDLNGEPFAKGHVLDRWVLVYKLDNTPEEQSGRQVTSEQDFSVGQCGLGLPRHPRLSHKCRRSRVLHGHDPCTR